MGAGELYIESGVGEDGGPEHTVCVRIRGGEAYAVVKDIEAPTELLAWKNACIALYQRAIAARAHLFDIER